MDAQQLIIDICKKEIECGCYEAEIDGVSLYSLVRENVRNRILLDAGYNVMSDRNKTDVKALIPALIKSIWQLFRLFCSARHYSIVFYSFARVEKISGIYVDKFSDPIIDVCELGDYIILDRGRAGVHPQPRAHNDRVLFIDALQVAMIIKSFVFYCFFVRKYQREFDKLSNSLMLLTGEKVKKAILREVVFMCYYYRSFGIILRKIKAKNVIGPARGQQKPLFIAARKMGIQTLELQHGVTFRESAPYSGYRDPMILPDFFLAFGDNDPLNVYGIDEERILNIGFALFDYISKLENVKKYNNNDILVISEPQITQTMIQIVLKLAADNPQISFYFRPHPHETITEDQKEQMKCQGNVYIQDRNINILEVLHGFKHVIGESSTVLYEALAMKKKVGRLHYPGLNPMYLSEKDKKECWQISNQNSFEVFIKGELPSSLRSIFSPFNKERLINILEKNNL